MATVQRQVGFASVELDNGCRIAFEAIDPASGSAVSGVTVVNAALWVDDLSGQLDATPLESGPFMLVPGPQATV